MANETLETLDKLQDSFTEIHDHVNDLLWSFKDMIGLLKLEEQKKINKMLEDQAKGEQNAK